MERLVAALAVSDRNYTDHIASLRTSRGEWSVLEAFGFNAPSFVSVSSTTGAWTNGTGESELRRSDVIMRRRYGFPTATTAIDGCRTHFGMQAHRTCQWLFGKPPNTGVSTARVLSGVLSERGMQCRDGRPHFTWCRSSPRGRLAEMPAERPYLMFARPCTVKITVTTCTTWRVETGVGCMSSTDASGD